jgi:Tfp pilus assembly protein PilO
MSAPSGVPLFRRITREHRRVVVPLVAALVANVLVYAFVVYPMSQRVANIEESSRIADSDLAAAKREFDQANGTLTGKDRASKELSTFYAMVLPRDLAGARRLTTLRLHQMARQAGLDLGSISVKESVRRDSTLKQLTAVMDLAGSYNDMREFIHQLEVASEFVIIDNVTLAEGADDAGILEVSLELSTYYQDAGQ